MAVAGAATRGVALLGEPLLECDLHWFFPIWIWAVVRLVGGVNARGIRQEERISRGLGAQEVGPTRFGVKIRLMGMRIALGSG